MAGYVIIADTGVANAAATVFLVIGIEYFMVSVVVVDSDTIVVSDNRCKIADTDDRVASAIAANP